MNVIAFPQAPSGRMAEQAPVSPRASTCLALVDFGAASQILEPSLALLAAAEFSQTDELVFRISRGFSGQLNRLEVVLENDGAANHAEAWLRQFTAAASGARFKNVAPSNRPCFAYPIAPMPEVYTFNEGGLWLAPCIGGASDFGRALAAAAVAGAERLSVSLRRRSLTKAERGVLERSLYRLRGRAPNDSLEDTLAFVERWRERRVGVQFDVVVEGATPLTTGALGIIGTAFFGRSLGPSEAPASVMDLRMCFPRSGAPPWAFCPSVSQLKRAPPPVAEPAPTPGAVILGIDAAGEPVRLPAEDRMRHLFVLGGTGVGKSTLFKSLIAQDVAAGEGVLLIDCHGDLADAVLEAVPASRRNDVIRLDPADQQAGSRLDLLSGPGIDPDLERNMIANQFVSLFRQQYAEVPEALGPAFEQYFRSALFLLQTATDPSDRSILKFEDVFADKAFRRRLVAVCPDRKVRQFWTDIAEETSGDSNLANIAPYIINKMNQITGSPLTRRLLSGTGPVFDFRRAMDERRIVVVRLSKGLLGAYDVRFLGAMLLMKLTEAALSRSRVTLAERTPFRVYIDEFQNLASLLAADLLAECRKYGLSLTLANQSLSQLGSSRGSADVAQATLANSGSLAIFRCNLADAREVNPLVAPEISAEDIVRLGVGEFIARRLVGGAVQPANRLHGIM